ncbi:hypothetical protein LJR038_005222 [Acidovorax sp. LjRoot38]|uniref:hypothetical protein n=1 Tax=Acidovorax sp. LjRoot38 TaxID=3342327 RepID=UPI003ECCA30F
MRPLVYPADWLSRDQPPPLADFGRRLLAEGDSWFTIGTLNLLAASNVLFKLEVSQTTAIVNCAYPGDTLQHMVEWFNDPYFDRLLSKKNFARYWEGILISAGGNDLIDAAQVPPERKDGTPVPRHQRLLLTAEEAATSPGTGAERFISEAGWDNFVSYMLANFAELVARRDLGPSKGRPIFLHTYATPTVRPSGTVGSPQGWLYPALLRYGLTGDAAQDVCDLLFGRLRAFLLALDESSGEPEAQPQVHVFDSAGLTTIQRADAQASDLSGHWVNEIHLSPDGYGELGVAFGPWMESHLANYP